MTLNETLQAFRDVFPDSKARFDGKEFKPQKLVTLTCERGGVFRMVNPEVCQWHLMQGSGICMNWCSNLWVERKLKTKDGGAEVKKTPS